MILATLEQNVFFHIMHGVVSTRHGAKLRSHLIYFDILYLIFMKRRICEYFGGNILRIFASLLIILCNGNVYENSYDLGDPSMQI